MNLIIEVSEGLVRNIYSDSGGEINVTVLDYDCDGIEDEALDKVDGDDVLVYDCIVDNDPEEIELIFKQIGR